jgi:2-(3-amino-3-carboxypropyl)histidine synthase
LEAIMLANPSVPAFRYDPYSRRMTAEAYDHAAMRAIRAEALESARSAHRFGIAISSLGRQANANIIQDVKKKLVDAGKQVQLVMMPEIKPEILQCIEGVEAWVQVACPRLSIDWGYSFPRPLLSPYELNLLLGHAALPDDHYPMDYYARNPGGPWSNYHFNNNGKS